ncbi:MAG TPA: hypothetical protein VGG79_00030 [Roseiarcus sp.]|jgi:hypothetical protein
MNNAHMTSVPDFLTARLDAKAALEGGTWQGVYRFALWLGLVAIDDRGGLRRTIEALGELPTGAHGAGRRTKVPREARELVQIAEKEGVAWQTAQTVAVTCGLDTIDARGGLNETKRQVEAARRLVVSQITARAK